MATPRAHADRDKSGSNNGAGTTDKHHHARVAADRMSDATREQIEGGARMMNETVSLASDSLEAADAATQKMTKTLDAMIHEMADRSRRSLAEAQSALRAMAQARTPAELFRAQADFSRCQIEGMADQISTLTNMAFETASQMGGTYYHNMTRMAEVYTSTLRH